MTQNSTHLSRSLAFLLFVAGMPVFAGSVPGIKNFDQVDGHVYRGGQPTDEGFRYLPMTGLIPPTDAETMKLLAILEDTNGGPVFVHCQHGADRTGAVIAAYHIDHDQWDSGRALQDAKAHSMSPFQLPRQAYIRNFHARATTAALTPSASQPVTAGVVN